MLIDTHAHVNFKDFESDFKEVLLQAREKNIVTINVGTQIRTSHQSVELAQAFDKTFAAVGLHPIHLHAREIVEEHTRFKSKAEDFDKAAFQELARMDQVVAIGECGLDYYHIAMGDDVFDIKEKQKKVLHQQIELANEESLPMIIHCRGSRDNFKDAPNDLLIELKSDLPQHRGVLHSFGGDWALAQAFLELGFYLGFNGIITFDKTGRTHDIISQMPLERLVLETDAPYLTPVPFRGQRNDPTKVEFVAEKIAELRHLSVEEVAEITTRNAKTLFNLAV